MNEANELYGLKRLHNHMASRRRRRHARPNILSNVKEFVGNYPQSDDMCLVCMGGKR